MQGRSKLATVVGLIGLVLLSAGSALGSSQPVEPSAGPSTEIVTLKIAGWTCATCEKDIRRALLAVPGVKGTDVSYASGGAVVEVDSRQVTTAQLVQAVASASTLFASYSAAVVPNGTLRITAEESGWRDWLSNLLR